MDDESSVKSFRLFSVLLLLHRISENKHRSRHHVFVKPEKVDVLLCVFQYISDIAGAYAQRVCGNHRILRSYDRILHGQEQVALSRIPRFAASILIGIQPSPAVGKKYKHKRRLCDEGLVVAAYRQRILKLLIRNVKY